MEMTPHDIRKLKKNFANANGIKMPDATIDGDDLEIVMSPDDNTTGLIVPYNEAGDTVFILLNNAILKRLRAECQDAARLMRRVASGERNQLHVRHDSMSASRTRQ